MGGKSLYVLFWGEGMGGGEGCTNILTVSSNSKHYLFLPSVLLSPF